MAMIFVGAQRRITLTFMVEGERKPRSITFWPKSRRHPNRVNRCPEEIWQLLLAKRGSPRHDGQDPVSPLEEYLQKGILWQVTGAQAQMIHEGKRPLMSPLGPEAGLNTHVPNDPSPDPENLTPAQRVAMERVLASDPSPTEMDLGEIDAGEIAPPPAAAPQPNPLYDPQFPG